MQNRFKFRLYDKKEKEMRYEVYATDYDLSQTNNYRFVLMQCTGLKDKNGKLIFEGDILKFYSQSIIDAMAREPLKERIGVAVWNEEELKFDVSVDNGKNVVPNLCKKTDDNNFEIIGNIYENPELLEEKK